MTIVTFTIFTSRANVDLACTKHILVVFVSTLCILLCLEVSLIKKARCLLQFFKKPPQCEYVSAFVAETA